MIKNNNNKILFIYPHLSTFVLKDLDILKTKFQIKVLHYENKKDLPKLIWGVLTTDLNFSWFALGYATAAVFFSKIFRKRSIIVAGGWDVINMPEISYGAMQSSRRQRKTKFTLKYANKILAVSESMKKSVLEWVPTSNVEIVYHGFNDFNYKSLDKEDIVISVGTSAWHTLKVKGIETFIKSAKYVPEIQFILIGPHEDNSLNYLKSISSANVDFINEIPFEDLMSYLKRARVYVQVSAQESFGSALAEAMLYECVPVVTNKGALPEVVGDTGFYVPYGDPNQTAQKIKEALKSNKGPRARERIITLYPLEKRKRKILEIIDEVLNY